MVLHLRDPDEPLDAKRFEIVLEAHDCLQDCQVRPDLILVGSIDTP
jgi:hypothetical protein